MTLALDGKTVAAGGPAGNGNPVEAARRVEPDDGGRAGSVRNPDRQDHEGKIRQEESALQRERG